MNESPKPISHIPIGRTRIAFDARAALHVLAVYLRTTTPNVRADGRSRNRAADRRNILPTPAANLVAEHAANHCARDGARNVWCIAALFDDLLPLDPATMLGCIDDGAYRGYGNDKETLAGRLDVSNRWRSERHRATRHDLAASAVMRNVDIVEPGVMDEEHRLAACVVATAMRCPVLGMSGRDVQVDRLPNDAGRHRLDDDRLSVDELRRREAADFDATVIRGLANVDPAGQICGEWRGRDRERGKGEKKTFHPASFFCEIKNRSTEAAPPSPPRLPMEGHYDIGMSQSGYPFIGRDRTC